MTFANGIIFKGTFKDGIPNEDGEMTFKENEEDGWVYKGKINKNYQFHGEKGIFKYSQGNYYEGDWSYNKLINNVKIKFIDGDFFEGNVGENLDYDSESYLYSKIPFEGKMTYVNKDIYKLSNKKLTKKTNKNAQEAHEAIRPTDLKKEQIDLYLII